MKIDRYNGTTKEQRKMTRAVAADVLLQLKKRAFSVVTGKYIDHPKGLDGFDSNGQPTGEEPVDIQTVAKNVLKQCEVCALGAMFVSRALLFNEYTFADHPRAKARADFGYSNSDLIETAFEQMYCGSSLPHNGGREALEFSREYSDDRKRLKAIMENVVANKGVFRPDKPAKTVAKSV